MEKEKKSNHYVDNKAFYDCIVAYKQQLYEAQRNGTELPQIPEYAGECIEKIAENVAFHVSKFSGYSYNDEMKSDSILTCIRYFDNFKEDKFDNPHAYFTRVCYEANKQRIKDEKMYRYVIYKTFENDMVFGNDPQNVYGGGEDGLVTKDMYDNISEYIDDYETSQAKKKAERKAKLEAKKREKKDNLEQYIEEDEDEND